MPTTKAKAKVREYEEAVEVLAEFDIGSLWTRMLDEALNKYVALDRQGLAVAEIEAELRNFLEGLSEAPEQAQARAASTVSYNLGRAEEVVVTADKGDVEWVMRSEVLDERTCPACVRLDGKELQVGTEEFDALMPPAECEGGGNCRGFIIPIG